MEIRIRRQELRKVEEHSLRSYPFEGCGLMMGRWVNDNIEVEGILPAENVERSATIFKADAEFVYQVIERAEKMGLSLVGIYHSHPNAAAYISNRDLEFMNLWPGVAWLIISLTEDGIREMKAYIFKKGQVEKLRIIVR